MAKFSSPRLSIIYPEYYQDKNMVQYLSAEKKIKWIPGGQARRRDGKNAGQPLDLGDRGLRVRQLAFYVHGHEVRVQITKHLHGKWIGMVLRLKKIATLTGFDFTTYKLKSPWMVD
jgi:hypothetical protein